MIDLGSGSRGPRGHKCATWAGDPGPYDTFLSQFYLMVSFGEGVPYEQFMEKGHPELGPWWIGLTC